VIRYAVRAQSSSATVGVRWTAQVSRTAAVTGLRDTGSVGDITLWPKTATHTRCDPRPHGMLMVVDTRYVEPIQRLLQAVGAPAAQRARALAMRLAALRVGARMGPKGDVTPWTTLSGPCQCVWPQGGAHKMWRTSQGVHRP
jgi:hypothetical protein